MKAAVLGRLGEVPRLADFREPDQVPGKALVRVIGAAIKPLDRAIAAGTHYSSPAVLPVVCGTDGVGVLGSGEAVYFWSGSRPFGSMADRALADWTVLLPAGLDPGVAAAVVNPAIAAWLPLQWRARITPGEHVLILGATGAAGRMAVRAARLLGAGRVVAAGRRAGVLATLGADATIDLTLPEPELTACFAAEAANGFDVIVDFVWGRPVEVLLATLTSNTLGTQRTTNIRLVSVGEMAGATITLPSAALRGAPLEIIGSGTANFPPAAAMQAIVAGILDRAESGQISTAVRHVPLADVEAVWADQDGDVRTVLML